MLQHSPLLCSREELTLKEDLLHPQELKDYAYKLKLYYIMVNLHQLTLDHELYSC